MKRTHGLEQRDFLRKHLLWKTAERDLKIDELIRLTAEVQAIEDAIDLEMRVRRGRSIHQTAVEMKARPLSTDDDLPPNFGSVE